MNQHLSTDGTTSASNQEIPKIPTQNTVEWVERECESCGETYRTMEILADLPGRDLCSDCTPPPGHLEGPIDPFESRPLMEYGPLSL